MSEELVLRIVVPGKPEPQGSASAFIVWKERPGKDRWKWVPLRRADGSIVVNVTSDNDALKAWREAVTLIARLELGRTRGSDFPLRGRGFTVELLSWLKRPRADWGTGKNAHLLKDHADAYPLTIPDADKLLRGAMDALTGVVWVDDSQVTDCASRKRYAVPKSIEDDGIRCELRVWLNDVYEARHLPLEERTRVVTAKPGAPADALSLLEH